MIIDRSIISARAEKERVPRGRVVRRIFAATIAISLTLPSLSAWGLEAQRNTPTFGNTFKSIALLPIPQLDSMPWLKWNAGGKALKVDTLLSPTLDPLGIKLKPEERDSVTSTIS
jgi:hypothetical protein